MRQNDIEALTKAVADLEAISEIVYSIGHPDEDAGDKLNIDLITAYLSNQIREAALQVGSVIDQAEVTA